MLNQIPVARPVVSRMRDQAPNGIELVIARKDQTLLTGLAAAIVFILHFVNEVLHEVEHAVARPDPVPEIGGRIRYPGWRDWRIACTAETALVEGEESRV